MQAANTVPDFDTTKPQPQRFQTYNPLPGGKSFTIKNCKYVFKLDRHGGWRDEYGHYYNASGEPDFEPEDADLTPSEGSIDDGDGYDHYDDYNQFQPDYKDDVQPEQEDAPTHWEIRNMEKISRNMEALSAYPLGKPLRVFFSNMPFKAPPKSVYQAYSKKVDGILNIIFDLEDNLRNGEGTFIIGDAKKAENLVKLQGQRVLQRQVHFQVENISDLVMDPISEKDMTPFWVDNKGKGKYSAKNQESKKEEKKQQVKQQKKEQVPKFKAAPAEIKQQTKKPQAKKQETKKQEPKKVEQNKPSQAQKPAEKTEVKKEEPNFKTYRLNFQIFATKTRFFNFIAEHGGDKDKDIKNIIKQENNGVTKITMDVSNQLIAKLKGKKYNEKEIVFTLI